MEFSLLPTSANYIRRARVEWGLSYRGFAALIGVKHQHIVQVEDGTTAFSKDLVGVGMGHPDPKVRGFWKDYDALCYRERMDLAIENGRTVAAVASEAGR